MKHYEDFEDELDDIRVKLYEETKHMSSSEFASHINAEADRICKEFGIQVAERRFGDSVIMLRKNARTRSTLGSVIDGVTPCPEFVLERPDNTAPQERDWRCHS